MIYHRYIKIYQRYIKDWHKLATCIQPVIFEAPVLMYTAQKKSAALQLRWALNCVEIWSCSVALVYRATGCFYMYQLLDSHPTWHREGIPIIHLCWRSAGPPWYFILHMESHFSVRRIWTGLKWPFFESTSMAEFMKTVAGCILTLVASKIELQSFFLHISYM